MTEKHLIITAGGDLTVKKKSGTLNRNSNSTQWLDIELDGWKLNEGEELYIELSRYDDDTELTTRVGPLHLFFVEELGRYVTIAPPELICAAGPWSYSLELRSDIVENGKGELTYNSLTSAIDVLTVTDSVISPSPTDSFTKETELLSAARVLGNAILAGATAEAAVAAGKSAQESAEQAGLQATAAQASEKNAAVSSESSRDFAESAERSKNEAVKQATNSAEAAVIAVTNANAAMEAARTATEKAAETARQTELVAEQAESVNVMLAHTRENAEAAVESAQISGAWARQAAELFATHSIKISTDFTAVADLPAEGNSQTIYFIPNGGENENSFDEYVWVGNRRAYEKIGSTAVDLSAYVPKSGTKMTGALAMPKIKVDKIARNEADSIYVEPKTTFHSQTTFEKNAIFQDYLTVKEIRSLDCEPIAVTSQLTGGTINGHVINAEYKVKTECLQFGKSDILMYPDSDERYIHSGAGEDNTHLVIRADSGITVCGSDNTDTDIDFNVLGRIKENGQRVYSPNNPDNTKMSKSGDTMTGELILASGQTARGFTDLNMNLRYNSAFLSGFYNQAFERYDKTIMCGDGLDKALIQYSYADGWHLRVSSGGDETMNQRFMDNYGGLYDSGSRVYSPSNPPPLYRHNIRYENRDEGYPSRRAYLTFSFYSSYPGNVNSMEDLFHALGKNPILGGINGTIPIFQGSYSTEICFRTPTQAYIQVIGADFSSKELLMYDEYDDGESTARCFYHSVKAIF